MLVSLRFPRMINGQDFIFTIVLGDNVTVYDSLYIYPKRTGKLYSLPVTKSHRTS